MHITKITKWDVVRDFVNMWLKEKTIYCNHCDADYVKGMPPCCDKPQYGDNLKFTMELVQALKDIRKSRDNEFGSNKTNTMRWGVSLPPRLYHDLDRLFKVQYGEKLFDNQKQMREFARKFPEFRVPERI
jgi:transposase